VAVWDVAGERDVTCDVSDPASIDAASEASRKLLGWPAWVTITAGRGHAGLLLDAAPEEFDAVMGVNVKGVWLAMRALARPMIESGAGGSIVVTSSVSAHVPDRGMGLYGASKAAVSALVRVAAAEWAAGGVRVNGIGPGVTDTPMLGPDANAHGWLDAVEGRTALGRLGRAEDIAPAIQALHELEWVTGQVLDCDGGLTLHSPIEPYGPVGRRSDRPSRP
jgi:NAD(P)-dependent dehydrogenase (short-subunit alcohol dehydrogenase family)